MAEQRYRVANKCKYDIGIMLPSGQQAVVRAGSFQMLTADDISFIETQCSHTKFFAKRMLVPYDSQGKEVPMDQVGMFVEPDPNPHMDDNELETMLKQPVKKMEAWINEIEDPAELHAIYDVAKKMDLPASKLKILSAKIPEKDFLS